MTGASTRGSGRYRQSLACLTLLGGLAVFSAGAQPAPRQPASPWTAHALETSPFVIKKGLAPRVPKASLTAASSAPLAVSDSPLALPAAAQAQTVAIHVSASTESQWRYQTWRYWHIQRFLQEALKSDGTPFVIVSDSDIAQGRLLDGGNRPLHPVLISLANEAISDEAATAISSFAQAGGWVFVGSSSWTRRPDGTRRMTNGRPTMALESVIGLESVGWTLLNYAIPTKASSSIDQLAPFVGQNRRWQMPLSYDLDYFGSVDYMHDSVHWTWAVKVPPGSPAEILLQHGRDRGFFRRVPATTWGLDYDVHFADMNGDGLSDVLGHHKITGNIEVGLSTSQGFMPSTSRGSWGPQHPIQLVDVNGDGYADIAGRLNNSNLVHVSLFNPALGRFQVSYAATTWSTAYDVHFGDVNGDGCADIVGRQTAYVGTFSDVQVGYFNPGTGTFQASLNRGLWHGAYSLELADLNGDRKADLLGRHRGGTNVMTSVMQPSGAFSYPQDATGWGASYSMVVGDVTGDGRADIVGRAPEGYRDGTQDNPSDFTTDVQVSVRQADGTFPSSASWKPPFNQNAGVPYIDTPDGQVYLADINGDKARDMIVRHGLVLEAWLSTGRQSPNEESPYSLLTETPVGQGRMVFYGEMQPIANYGIGIGAANKGNDGYKILRDTINRAFHANQRSTVRLSPWPYPYHSALVSRHDHVLNMIQVNDEQQRSIAGEFYLWPPDRDDPGFPVRHDDFPDRAGDALRKGAVIGAHVYNHVPLDMVADRASGTNPAGKEAIRLTVQDVAALSGAPVTHFVSPGYYATQPSSMKAIWENGLLTTGDVGYGPFPAFSLHVLDPAFNGDGYVYSLLQVPVTGAMDQISSLTEKQALANMVGAVGGLFNLYDHGGESGPSKEAAHTAAAEQWRAIYDYILTRPRIWKTTSAQLRAWWLQRERWRFQVTAQRTASTVEFTITQSANAGFRAGTNVGAQGLALRWELSPSDQTLAQQRVQVTLDGAPSVDHALEGRALVVRTGGAATVKVTLGQ